MHPFMKRIQALESGGASAACELVCVELEADGYGLPVGSPICAQWRDQRFDRQANEEPMAFRARVRAAVCEQLPPQLARTVLFLEGSDREG